MKGLLHIQRAMVFAVIALASASGLALGAKDAPVPLAPWDRVENVRLGSFDRHFIVHVPPSFEPKRKHAVVIMLHGAGGTGQQAMAQTGWDRKADREDFIAVFPDGVPEDPRRRASFLRNPQTWNEGSGRHASGKRNDADIEFIGYVIDTLEARYGADPHRVYVTGFSNGASMTFRIGDELSDKVAAIAPVAGHLFVHQKLRRAVPTLYIIGRDDPLELPKGGVLKIGREQVEQPPIEQNLAQWCDLDGCPRQPTGATNASGVDEIIFEHCRDGAEVVEYFVGGMGHVWPGGSNPLPESLVGKPSDKLNATDVIWNFFRAHSKAP